MEEHTEEISLLALPAHKISHDTERSLGRDLWDRELPDIPNSQSDEAHESLKIFNNTNIKANGLPPSRGLKRSPTVLLLILIYMTLALFSWVVTCILAFRPITVNHYGAWIWNNDNNGYGWASPEYIHSLYVNNETWFQASRTIQSIVGVLTVPLASAVCSAALVVYVQHCGPSSGLTLRQVLTLADGSWADPVLYARLILSKSGWKKYGTPFLFLAIALNILGGVISPLQTIFLSTITIKTPTWPQAIPFILDIPDQFSNSDGYDSNLVVVLTRSTLSTATNMEPQEQLWQGAGYTCDVLDINGSIPNSCGYGATFGNMSTLTNPFLAQLRNGYNTGLIRQFIPRINSTADYRNISETDYPSNCESVPGGFYIKYSNISSNSDTQPWSIEACMPYNVSQTPWKSTRDRQDFSEELYLNITLPLWEDQQTFSQQTTNLYQINLNTTAGYFELPNYMNGQLPGPLLDKDPNNQCGNDCEPEGLSIYDHSADPKEKRQSIFIDNSTSLELVMNKGPLLTIAMALFSEGSFIPTRLTYQSATKGPWLNSNISYSSTCIDLAPLGFLLADSIGQTVIGNSIDYCINNYDEAVYGGIDSDISSYIANFNLGTELLKNAFNSAAFLANQAWMLNNVATGRKSLTVTYDLGADTQVPSISTTGVIIISTMLGLFLAIVLALAIYAFTFPAWTEKLDSFAMMRLGASVADQTPLLIARDSDRIQALDKIPGWIGDVAEDDEPIGRLGLGAKRRLAMNSRKGLGYASYENDR